MPKQTTTPKPSLQQLFDSRQTSLWEEGVRCLCKEYKLNGYLLNLEEGKRVAEFSALVNYLGPKGEFRHHEHGFVSAIMRADSRHRRSEAEAILMRQNWEGVNLAKDLCVACIPYATAGTLREIGSFTAGCSALGECLRKQPDRREKLETTGNYYVNLKAQIFSGCSPEAREKAEQENYHLWLQESLSKRIHVGHSGLEEWGIAEENICQAHVDYVLSLIQTRVSELQHERENAIKDATKRKPQDLEDPDPDADVRTLVEVRRLW